MSLPELDRMKSIQYKEGKTTMEEQAWAGSLFRRLVSECPHVDDRDIVSLFRFGNEELITATAHRLEYNATHPPDGPGRTSEDA
ncbi:MAG: hypothetical protein KY455_01275 [Euryarchaeota archaeon]|nr:hypothetical protein [Euryarchaeota archaeon]